MNDTASNEKKDKNQVDPFLASIINEEAQFWRIEQLEKNLLEIQHKNNLEIYEKQVKLTKFSTYATIAATLLASLLGVSLGWYLTTRPEAPPKSPMKSELSPEPKKPGQQHDARATPVHRIETVESVVVLKNTSSVTPGKRK